MLSFFIDSMWIFLMTGEAVSKPYCPSHVHDGENSMGLSYPSYKAIISSS